MLGCHIRLHGVILWSNTKSLDLKMRNVGTQKDFSSSPNYNLEFIQYLDFAFDYIPV